jgi:signal transduction histidine kinase
LGVIELQKQPIDLSDWLPPSLLSWRTAALDKGLTWRVEIAKNLPIIDIDPDRMAQVVGNLLSNAIKYSPGGGEIAVSSAAGPNEVWIEISDTGSGISAEEHERVFEPFYRSQRIRRFPQGLGLGLTIARDLVQAHGGRLELVSEPGNGSQFTIYLPYK